MSTPATTPDTRDASTTLLVTLTGPDRPGLNRELFTAVTEAVGAAAGEPGTEVLDLEQVVVRGRIIIAALLDPGDAPGAVEAVTAAVERLGPALGVEVAVDTGQGDNLPRRRGRAAVVVLGAPLDAHAVAAVTHAIAEQGANIDRIRRLSRFPVTTIELDVSGADVPELRSTLALVSVAEGVDIAVAAAGLARRGRRLVVMDVDSTFIQDEVIELLARHAGREAEVAEVTERAMRGELDFGDSLRERVATLAGLPVSVLDEVRAALRLTPGARTLVRTLHRLGFNVALVSGGFVEIIEPMARELGIHHVRANRLEVEGGRLTGRTVGEIVDRAAKARALREIAAEEGLPLSRTVAIGDGANDLDMLRAAGLGIAFNAKPVVREQADTAVNVPYLDAVLYLLGLSHEDVDEAEEQ